MCFANKPLKMTHFQTSGSASVSGSEQKYYIYFLVLLFLSTLQKWTILPSLERLSLKT